MSESGTEEKVKGCGLQGVNPSSDGPCTEDFSGSFQYDSHEWSVVSRGLRNSPEISAEFFLGPRH